MSELFDWAQVHKVAGIFALDGAGDTNVDEHIVASPNDILRLRMQEVFEF